MKSKEAEATPVDGKKPKWGQMDYWEKVYWLQKTFNLLLMQAKYAVDECLPLQESIEAAKTYNPFTPTPVDGWIDVKESKILNMKKYVVGFAFNDNHVLLIKKERPKWQKGLYNGLGGHIEGDEQPIDAMLREFEEECGIVTIAPDWEQFCIMQGDDWVCYCFRSRNIFDLGIAKQTTDEQPKIINAYTLENYPTISNIPALVGLAMDGYGPNKATFDYSVSITPTPTSVDEKDKI